MHIGQKNYKNPNKKNKKKYQALEGENYGGRDYE